MHILFFEVHLTLQDTQAPTSSNHQLSIFEYLGRTARTVTSVSERLTVDDKAYVGVLL